MITNDELEDLGADVFGASAVDPLTDLNDAIATLRKIGVTYVPDFLGDVRLIGRRVAPEDVELVATCRALVAHALSPFLGQRDARQRAESLLDEAAAKAAEPVFVQGVGQVFEDVPWLWRSHLVKARAALLHGGPDEGKGLVAASICGTVTTGGRWPDGSGVAEPGVCVWLGHFGEDDSASVIAPRLQAAGVDWDRMLVLDTRASANADLSLREVCEATAERKPALAVIDSWGAWFGADGDNPNLEGDTRRRYQAVEPLLRVGAAVVIICHDNKDREAQGQDRVSGSRQLTAGARVALHVAERTVTVTKGNLGPKPRPLAFDIAAVEVAGLSEPVGVVSWLGELQPDARVPGDGGGDVTGEAATAVLDHLQGADEPATRNQIRKALGYGSQKALTRLDRVLTRLLAAGRIEVVKVVRRGVERDGYSLTNGTQFDSVLHGSDRVEPCSGAHGSEHGSRIYDVNRVEPSAPGGERSADSERGGGTVRSERVDLNNAPEDELRAIAQQKLRLDLPAWLAVWQAEGRAVTSPRNAVEMMMAELGLGRVWHHTDSPVSEVEAGVITQQEWQAGLAGAERLVKQGEIH